MTGLIRQKKKTRAVAPSELFAERYNGTVDCPWCGSNDSKLSSPFGSTVSEMIFTCGGCGETFGWMKWEQHRSHVERRDHIESRSPMKSKSENKSDDNE